MRSNRVDRPRRSRSGRYLAGGVACAVLATGTTAWAVDRPERPVAGAVAAAGTEAPKDFDRQLRDLYRQSVEIRGLLPRTAEPAVDPKQFDGLVDRLTRDDLDAIYAADPGMVARAKAALSKVGVQRSEDSAPPSSAASASVREAAAGSRPIPPLPEPQVSDPPALARCLPLPALLALYTALVSLKLSAGIVAAAAGALGNAVEGKVVAVPGPKPIVVGETIFPFRTAVGKAIANALEAAGEGVQLVLNFQSECKYLDVDRFERWAMDALAKLGEYGEVLVQGQTEIRRNQARHAAQVDAGFADVDQRVADLQTAADAAQASLDQQLRHRIESALTGLEPAATFQQPATAGGYLDATPIGVRQTVISALKAMRDNDQPVDSAAGRYLALAENALTAKQYKKAFAYYQQAYTKVAEY